MEDQFDEFFFKSHPIYFFYKSSIRIACSDAAKKSNAMVVFEELTKKSITFLIQ